MSSTAKTTSLLTRYNTQGHNLLISALLASVHHPHQQQSLIPRHFFPLSDIPPPLPFLSINMVATTTLAVVASALVGLVNGHGYVTGTKNNGVWTEGQNPNW